MKHQILISIALAVGSLGIAACDKNKSAPDSTPPPAVAPADSTAAPTTGESVPGTGDTRPISKVVDDAVITTKVNASLLAEPDLKASNITVETRAGTVTLMGTVPSAAHSDKAASIARGIDGVKSVDNQLTIS